MFRDHGQIPGIPPLPLTPAEVSGFEGWRDQDDSYWENFRGREVSFRAPTCFVPEDLESPPRPLDRNGKPTTYPAAVQYNFDLGQWVATSEEEEERLRKPSQVIDPYFVSEAKYNERHTSLAPEAIPETAAEEDESGREDEDVVLDFTFPDPPPIDMSAHRRKPLNMKPGGWRVVHLGTSSAVPTKTRNVSSTAVIMKPYSSESGEEPSMFLVDAGENTDDRLIRCDWCMTHGFRWIRAIFITHLHGDHIYGLPTLLTNIGRYAQYRRRLALENGEDGSDPVIQIYGPYGTRGFVRASLYWTNPVGVRFSIAELIPRQSDFLHLRGFQERGQLSETYVLECGDTEIKVDPGIDVTKESPPPHPEEVRAEDVVVSRDGLWHVWENVDDGVKTEVVAAPLQHRMPCFGYVFRESMQPSVEKELSNVALRNGSHSEAARLNGNSSAHYEVNGAASLEIDKVRAKELGVHGTQLRVLRSGRPITVSKTGRIVHPQDVVQISSKTERVQSIETNDNTSTARLADSPFRRKVTILGDTCDSSAISEAAMDSDLLVHEATFTEGLKSKAKVSMHSTALMAGRFGREIRAKKLALTHFSSRFEMLQGSDEGKDASRSRNSKVNPDSAGGDADEKGSFGVSLDEDEDLVSPNVLVREAIRAYGDEKANIIAARDFMEHDITPASSQALHKSQVVVETYALKTEAARTD